MEQSEKSCLGPDKREISPEIGAQLPVEAETCLFPGCGRPGWISFQLRVGSYVKTAAACRPCFAAKLQAQTVVRMMLSKFLPAEVMAEMERKV